MTQEDKQLLLKDLCARLPYKPYVEISDSKDWYIGKLLAIDIEHDKLCGTITNSIATFEFLPKRVKLYLRPMSSMTEEEREELSDYLCEQVMSNKIGITIPPNPTQGKGIPFTWMGDCLDWLNKKMFDFRGLIPKGLALPAPEGMYKN